MNTVSSVCLAYPDGLTVKEKVKKISNFSALARVLQGSNGIDTTLKRMLVLGIYCMSSLNSTLRYLYCQSGVVIYRVLYSEILYVH